MNTEVLVKVPWTDVVIVVTKLLKFSKGGISKDEGNELISLLTVLGAQIAGSIGPELTDDTKDQAPKKRKK